MLTKNFYIALSALFGREEPRVTTNASNLELVDINGDTHYATYSNSTATNFSWYSSAAALLDRKDIVQSKPSVSTSNTGVVFGTGNNPASINDYWISGDLINNISVLNIYRRYSTENSSIYTVDYNITNNNSQPITIKEIGVLGIGVYNQSSKALILTERTVLDEPVVIQPNEIGVVSHTITFAIPTA